MTTANDKLTANEDVSAMLARKAERDFHFSKLKSFRMHSKIPRASCGKRSSHYCGLVVLHVLSINISCAAALSRLLPLPQARAHTQQQQCQLNCQRRRNQPLRLFKPQRSGQSFSNTKCNALWHEWLQPTEASGMHAAHHFFAIVVTAFCVRFMPKVIVTECKSAIHV